MGRIYPLLAAVLLAIGAGAPARADSETAFREGRWADAVREGHAENSLDGFIRAGRSQLWQAAYETRDKARAVAIVEAAERDFDAALARAPGNAEAQLQKGVAVGYRAKLANSPGLAKQSRDRFLDVRDRHPENPLAWSAVAGWHGGGVAALGGFMAGAVLGAKTSEFERGYAQVFKLAPRNPAYRTLYALTALDLGEKNAARAAAALKGIETLPAADAFEAKLRAQGVQLAASLARPDREASVQLARKLAAFGNLE